MKDTVLTRYGYVQGEVVDGVARFLGVPFAKPPIAELRWRAPEECEPWQGVKPCREYAPICPQHSWLDSDGFDMSEDCLYLNIWTPAKDENEKLPVVLWIHGGGFTGGTSREELTKGMIPAKQGIIVVSIQYRLGVFGFLAHRELSNENEQGVSGNYGILDQKLAVKWVYENIARFGGDPEKITLAGQSAGGDSVCRLLLMDDIKPMVRGAIIQSGGPHPTRVDVTLADAEAYGEVYMKAAGVNSIEELRRVPETVLNDLGAPGFKGFGAFRPVLDGVYLKRSPFEGFRNSGLRDIPLVLSCTLDEGRFGPFRGGKEDMVAYARDFAGDKADDVIKEFGLDTDAFSEGASEVGSIEQVVSHCRMAQKVAGYNKSRVYVYRFTERLLLPDGTVFKAGHSEDLRFTWGRADRAGDCRLVPEERHYRLAENSVRYLTNFVKNGDPNGEGLPEWKCANEDSFYLDLNSTDTGTKNAADIKGAKTVWSMLDGKF